MSAPASVSQASLQYGKHTLPIHTAVQFVVTADQNQLSNLQIYAVTYRNGNKYGYLEYRFLRLTAEKVNSLVQELVKNNISQKPKVDNSLLPDLTWTLRDETEPVNSYSVEPRRWVKVPRFITNYLSPIFMVTEENIEGVSRYRYRNSDLSHRNTWSSEDIPTLLANHKHSESRRNLDDEETRFHETPVEVPCMPS